MHKNRGINRISVSFSLTPDRKGDIPSTLVNNHMRAFTLIELLIVVAIIAILAAIAVPNFLEAQTRAKVSRVIADMRSMQTGVELYRIDHNNPPVRNDNWNSDGVKRYAPDGNTKIFDPADFDAKVGLRQLTTPISYLNSIPDDVFNTPMRALMNDGLEGASMALDYFDPEQVRAFRRNLNPGRPIALQGFALFSVGPDQYFGGLNGRVGYPSMPSSVINTMRQFYDPSNGTLSVGNVYRFSDGLTQEQIFPIR